eukprot:1343776-Pyramimonas_sp.AAC.1
MAQAVAKHNFGKDSLQFGQMELMLGELSTNAGDNANAVAYFTRVLGESRDLKIVSYLLYPAWRLADIHLKHYPDDHPEVEIDRLNLKAVKDLMAEQREYQKGSTPSDPFAMPSPPPRGDPLAQVPASTRRASGFVSRNPPRCSEPERTQQSSAGEYSLFPSVIGSRYEYIISTLLRLVPAMGIFSLPCRHTSAQRVRVERMARAKRPNGSSPLYGASPPPLATCASRDLSPRG